MTDTQSDLKAELRTANDQLRKSEVAMRKASAKAKSVTIWGVATALFIVVVGGHWFPGYQLDSTADKDRGVAVTAVQEKLLAHLCAERFMGEEGLKERATTLNALNSEYDQVKHLREGSWGVGIEGESAGLIVAEQCLDMIGERLDTLTESKS